MIAINELKIGNLVLYNGVEWYIDGIHRGYPHPEERFNEQAYVDLAFDGIVSATLEEIEPIPITEEILEKFGFERYVRGVMRKDLVYVSKDIEGNWMSSEEYGVKLSVHYLQNLYYVLRGKELTF